MSDEEKIDVEKEEELEQEQSELEIELVDDEVRLQRAMDEEADEDLIIEPEDE